MFQSIKSIDHKSLKLNMKVVLICPGLTCLKARVQDKAERKPKDMLNPAARISKLFCSAEPHVNWAWGLQTAISGAARAEKNGTNLR